MKRLEMLKEVARAYAGHVHHIRLGVVDREVFDELVEAGGVTDVSVYGRESLTPEVIEAVKLGLGEIDIIAQRRSRPATTDECQKTGPAMPEKEEVAR